MTSWPLAFAAVVPVLPAQLPAAQPWTPSEKSNRTCAAVGYGLLTVTDTVATFESLQSMSRTR